MPFVWSDQYDRKIQTVGHFRGDDEMEVVYGSLDERRFVAVFGRNGSSRRRARIFHARQGHAVSQDDRGACVVRRRARTRTLVVSRRRDTAREPLLTRRFVVVVLSGVFYFLAMGSVLPVVPRYVDKQLGGNDVAVGVAVGALAVGAILLRPLAGRIGDRFGRRVLMVGGAFVVGITAACAGLVESLAWLILTRILMGLGEACFFVGGTTMATDLAPESRRGEAVSYWSVAVWSGLAFGPALGELLLDRSHYDRVWFVAGACAFTSALIALATKETHTPTAHAERGPLIAPAAIRPGIILAATLLGITGFSIFLPLYGPEVGVDDVGAVFLVYGIIVLGVRILGARLPDLLGPIRAGSIAIAATALGLTIVAAWSTPVGLVIGAVIIAVGSSFLYPAALLLTLRGVSEQQRASVVGTFERVLRLLHRRGRDRPGRPRRGLELPGCVRGIGADGGTGARAPADRLRGPRRRNGPDGGGGRAGDGRADVDPVTALLVTNDFPPKIGGIQSYLYELWRRLPPDDATVLTTRHEGDASWDAQQSFRVVRAPERQFLPTPSLTRRIDALARDLGASRDLRRPVAALGTAGAAVAPPRPTS